MGYYILYMPFINKIHTYILYTYTNYTYLKVETTLLIYLNVTVPLL